MGGGVTGDLTGNGTRQHYATPRQVAGGPLPSDWREDDGVLGSRAARGSRSKNLSPRAREDGLVATSDAIPRGNAPGLSDARFRLRGMAGVRTQAGRDAERGGEELSAR